MKLLLDRFYSFLDRPLRPVGRLVLLGGAVLLVLSFVAPLWRISMTAPQYPKGLVLDIYSYKITGGNDGADIAEINTLNHYIGMREITRDQLVDLDWMPFGLGLMVLLALRVAAIGNVRSLVDLMVLVTYISGFAFFRFVYTLNSFGHDLDPRAAITVEPFDPVIFGTKQIANFETTSYPQGGSVFIGAFVAVTAGVLLWHLWVGRREAVRASRAADSTDAA